MLAFLFGRYRRIESRTVPVVIGFSVVMLALRLLLAMPFWASGQTRWVSFPTKIASSTTYLFENLFVLHFGLFELPIPFPVLTAYVTSVAEIVLPVAIVLGIFTRLGALMLFAMSVVIELVFPKAFINLTDPMNSHALWMAYGLLIFWFGPGLFSLDWLAWRFVLPGRFGTGAAARGKTAK